MQALLLGGMQGHGTGLVMPFSWTDVTLAATGHDRLRVALRPAGEQRVSIELADPGGAPVARVGELVLRAAASEQLHAARRREGLLSVEWRERGLPEADPDVPAAVEQWRWPPEDGDADPTAAGRRAVTAALGALQAWLAREDSSPEDRLAIITSGAVAVTEEEIPDPAAAAIWGLVRSAQAEHPESFVLVDTDGDDASAAALGAALAQGEESQVALRGGVAHVPRWSASRLLTRRRPSRSIPTERCWSPAPAEPWAWPSPGTWSRPTARAGCCLRAAGERRRRALPSWRAELEEAGAEVEIAACDVADRERLAALLEAIPDDRPLGAVFHLAGTVDDATVESLDAERFDAVFAPKADGTAHLCELTAGAGLSAFVVFSSASATLGARGSATTPPPTPSPRPSSAAAAPRACRRPRSPGAPGMRAWAPCSTGPTSSGCVRSASHR